MPMAGYAGPARPISAPRSWRTTRKSSPPAVRAGLCHRQAGGHARRHLERRWGEIALTFVEVQIRSGLSVPVELGGGPIGTLDVYVADPRGWDPSEVAALQAYAALVGTLLAAASKAELSGALADQLQTALDSRGLIERAKGALMERERLDDQEAFTHLRRAARSSGRKLTEVAREVAAGKPLPRGRARPTPTSTEQPTSNTEPPQPDA